MESGRIGNRKRGALLKVILACDLGGTRMKFGVIHQKQVLASTIAPAHARQDLRPQLPTIKAIFAQLLEGLGRGWRDCAGFSLSFPSIVDGPTGRVLAEYGKFADAPQIDLAAWSHTELGLPLAIENDARMAMIGEHYAGAGAGCNNLVMITLGTGIGVSALIEGKVLRGSHGQAGILGGHLSVRFDGRPCICGNLGCAEAEASTSFLKELAAELPGWPESALAKRPVLDYQAVFEDAAGGDACARMLKERSLAVWSTLAVSLIHAYDPEMVIFGGGIMAAQDQILPAVQEYVGRHASTPWGKVRVLASQLGDNAALIAGEWLVKERYPELEL